MELVKKPCFNNAIAIYSNGCKMTQMNCKTFIHRFDSDRRLQFLLQFTSRQLSQNSTTVAKIVALIARSGHFGPLASLRRTSPFLLAPLIGLRLSIPAASLPVR